MKVIALGGRVSPSQAPVSQGLFIAGVVLAPCSRARRCIASMKGTSSCYHLLALLRSEYSIVSASSSKGDVSLTI